MKNYSGVSNSAHKKGVQSMGGPVQTLAMTTGNATMGNGSTSSTMRQSSLTPHRNSNQPVILANSSQTQEIKLNNQKSATAQHLGEQAVSQMTLAQVQIIPQKMPKQISSSQPRGNFIKKQKMNQSGNGTGQNTDGLRGSSQQLPANIESIQQLGNVKNSVGMMMNGRIQQPSPSVKQMLNQNTSIDDILAQQNFATKQINNSTALIGSSRKAQKIQIHMKNNRFHNRKASGPAALNISNAAAGLQNKQFMMQQSNDRISNYESAQQNSVQYLDQQLYNSQVAQTNMNISQSQKTRASSRQGVRSGNQSGAAPSSSTMQRPGSKTKSLNRSDQQNAQGQNIGRTFFHPPSGMSTTNFDQHGGQNGPAQLDHNQILASQFNTTGQIQMGNHVRAGTQIDVNTGTIKGMAYMPRKDSSQERGNFQKPSQIAPGSTTQFDLPSGKHSKSKSHNKFSQPELARYNNSIERIGMLGNSIGLDTLTMQANIGGSNSLGQNYAHNQQAQLKQNLQKPGSKVDIMMNSAYSLKTTNRKQMKASQQIQKKMLSGVSFPVSLNQTQSVRFVPGGKKAANTQQVPSIANYSASGNITQSTNQSGMNSTTQPNAHLIFNEGQHPGAQSHFVNTATIPLIKNGEPQPVEQMKGNYNTQMLDRIFSNQQSTIATQSSTKGKQRVASKGASAISLGKQGSASMSNGPNASDFMPSSVTSATAFYAAQKQAQAQSNQMFSNYQIQNMSKQKGLLVNKQGSGQNYPTNPSATVDMNRIPSHGGQTLQQIMSNQAQQLNTMGVEHGSVQADKGNKNSFYLKQQLQQNNRSKDRSQGLKKGQGDENQHRKNHSVVINRAEIMRVDSKQRKVDNSPDRFIGQSNKALKLPGMQDQSQYNSNYASQFGDQPSTDYLKNLNQSATNANTRALKTKTSARSVERLSKQGAMTPSNERIAGTNTKVKGSQSITHEKTSYLGSRQPGLHDAEQQYPGSSGINYPQVLNNTKQVMVTDGGTGASLKRVFIQQESTHTSQADSQSNYGSTLQYHTQNYHLPIKSGNAGVAGMATNKQSKRIQMQKMNANKFHKGNPQMANHSYQAAASHSAKIESEQNLAANVKPNTSSGIATSTDDQTLMTRYQDTSKENSMINPMNEIASQKPRADPRKEVRAISVGPPNDYMGGSLEDRDGNEANMGSRKGARRSISINITEEALRLGKLPTEKVALNIAQNKYNKNGSLKGKTGAVSPRVIEMIGISNQIKNAFQKTDEAPETTTEFYRAGKMLGRGAFGKVNLGMQKLTRKLIAIKSINQEYLTDDKQRSKIMHEVGILLRLRHPSVVKLYETFETKRHIMLVMELCAGGDLLNFVRKRKKCDEPLAKVLFKQIIEGIGYCHSKSILHRDIKLDNILLDGKGNVKIADFGVSKTVKPGEIMYEQSGTPAYIAPEIIRNEGYKGFKADLWSAGVVLFALLFGTVPFKANNMKDLHQQILQAKYNMKEEISDEAKDLLRGLLNTDVKKRLGVQKVLRHPWLAGAELLSTDIFNEQEKEVIRSEFTYNDPSRFNRNERINNEEEPWDCFTELNLDSMNQTLRNASEKSLILAPFNSTMSDVDAFFKEILQMAPMEEKKETLKFAARCRDQDRQYEINNNAELDNGVYHKFVYSTKDSKADDDKKAAKNKGREDGEEQLLSRNCSRQNLKDGQTNEDSEDLTKARDKASALQKGDLKKEREALKADILKMKGGKKSAPVEETKSYDSEDELANTNNSNFTVVLDDDRVATLANFGYPIDYVKYTILENEANYCVTAYYLLGTDQNY